ncbi:MAG: alpha/beta hydrolase [Verrucomicrobia bacterium]|nr:alpha/beta hydrolase [Verrucomicrobiota bacterium]
MIYFPTTFAPERADAIAAKRGFVPWKNVSGEIIGWQLPARRAATGAVLIVHGNAGSAVERGYIARPIHEAAAVDVFVLEYPGYGARGGSPSEKSFLSAADEAFSLLTHRAPVFVVSESLGTGVAAHLAGTHGGRVAGLAFIAPYNDLVSVGQRKMPFLPVRLILQDRFPAAAWLRDSRRPAVFLLAGEDEVIPTGLGLKLHDGYAGPKKLHVIPGAQHNDIAEQSPDWWAGVFEFWRENGVRQATD